MNILINIINKYRCVKHGKVIFHRSSVISRDCVFQGNNKIYENAHIFSCDVGFGTYIGPRCDIHLAAVGKYCSIGPGVTTAVGNHPSRIHVSTHPAFFSPMMQAGFSFTSYSRFNEFDYVGSAKSKCIEIGNDVWIGSRAMVLGGVKIGDGAIIGAGTIVNKDVPPYTIVVGCPMRIIRKRFSDSQCESLLKLKWWDKDVSWLKKNISIFSNIDQFLQSAEDGEPNQVHL